jgi:predicted Zn-dependent protease
MRKQVAEPPRFSRDQGAMLSVRLAGVEAYAATSDLSRQGLQTALERATALARRIAPQALLELQALAPSSERGEYRSPGLEDDFPSLAACYQLLAAESAAVPSDPRLVNWRVGLDLTRVEQLYLNNSGAELRQAQRFVYPHLSVTAYDGQDSQTRRSPTRPCNCCWRPTRRAARATCC